MTQFEDMPILGVGSMEEGFRKIVELQNSTDKSAFTRYPRELRLLKPITRAQYRLSCQQNADRQS
jgi:hypothetical protein